MTTHEAGKLRVMVDANILIAGTGWPRFPYEVLQHAVLGDFQLVLCPYIIAEARRHIDRVIPEMRAQFEQILATCQFEEVPNPSLAQVEASADLVRDVKDIPVALAAIKAQVDCLGPRIEILPKALNDCANSLTPCCRVPFCANTWDGPATRWKQYETAPGTILRNDQP